jgi:3-oxoisoapionate decarboxylase
LRVGVTSFAFRWAVSYGKLDATSLLSRAGAYSVDVVQLCENLGIEEMTTREIDSLTKTALSNAITLELGCRGSDPSRLRRHLAIAKQMNVNLLRVILSDEKHQTSKLEAIKNLLAVIDEFATVGITLAVENHFELPPKDVADIIQDINSPFLRACVDPLNSISHLVGPSETIRTLLPYAASIHIKDASVRREGTGFLVYGAPFGTGVVGVMEIMSKIATLDKEFTVHVESWIDTAEDLEATIRREDREVGRSVKYLKGDL